ncbi:GntR family transcriptional regulator [Nocardioides zhouii]|uniref:GntR family transcriptional regulator n=2 Tax=Nocardioides zhouii TaxID=1168729 RepID=A0A4Q2SNX2_9ACTN|nr:GntR family transcriptional regulator [Nocardioides zhouii]
MMDTGIEREARLPYYEQLKQLLLAEIAHNDLKPGHLMPSEAEMCARYGVSRTVVRQAVGELVSEGILQRMRGKGTFVARPKLSEQFMESTVGFFEDMTGHGHSVTSTVLSVDRIEVPDLVRERTGNTTATHCTEIVRLRAVDHEVVAFTKSYLNNDDPALLEHLRSVDLTSASLYQILEDSFGLRIESGHRSIEATAASSMMAKLLDVRPGEPLLYIESVGQTAQGTVAEFFRAWHRADRLKIEMDVVRSKRGPARLPPTLA